MGVDSARGGVTAIFVAVVVLVAAFVVAFAAFIVVGVEPLVPAFFLVVVERLVPAFRCQVDLAVSISGPLCVSTSSVVRNDGRGEALLLLVVVLVVV